MNLLKILLITFSFVKCFSQEYHLIITIEPAENKPGYFLYNCDGTFFEYFYHCSYENGVRLKDSLPDGNYYVYHNDTLKYYGRYKYNVKDSIWTHVFANGNISHTETFKNGLRNGNSISYNDKGEITNLSYYEKDDFLESWNIINGELLPILITKKLDDKSELRTYFDYYENGVLEQKSSYLDGKSYDQHEWFYENGNLKRLFWYDQIQLKHVSIDYDIDGNIIDNK